MISGKVNRRRLVGGNHQALLDAGVPAPNKIGEQA
jgi:hypothetical protein